MRKNEAIWIEKSKRWQIKVQKDGVRRAFYSSTPSKRGKIEAEKKADNWLASNTKNENIRFAPLWADFLAEVHLTTSTSNYRNHELHGRRWFLPRLEHKYARDITIQNWQDCLNDAYRSGLSKKSIKNIRGSVTAFYKYSFKRGIPMVRPEFLEIPRDAPVGEKKILQPDNMKTLFSEDTIVRYGKEEPAFFIHAWRFMVLAGPRRGELCGIDQRQDLKGNTLFIRRSINHYNEVTGGKTDNAQRGFVLSSRAMEEVEAQKEMLKRLGIKSRWLFPDENGDRLDPKHLSKKWETYRKQHGISCSLHELRHTLISVAKADVPEELLKMIVGHSANMDTFGVYGHEVDGELERAAKLLDKAFDRILK